MAQSMSKTERKRKNMKTERVGEPKFNSRLEGGGLGGVSPEWLRLFVFRLKALSHPGYTPLLCGVYSETPTEAERSFPSGPERVSQPALNPCCCRFLIFLEQKTLEVAQRRAIITRYGKREGGDGCERKTKSDAVLSG